MRYEWDPEKDNLNLRLHGISFDEILSAFDDPNALDLADERHSDDEQRYNIIGITERGLVFVVYTEREDDVIRIISARKATRNEEQQYVEE